MTYKSYYVYILASRSRAIYVGITSDLERRIEEHKQRLIPGHASKYNINRLVHYEDFQDPDSAIDREKQIKRWARSKKVRLIEIINPEWKDLGEELE
ncbi:MAG: GIY-YIG nuclease family protein [bacterium]